MKRKERALLRRIVNNYYEGKDHVSNAEEGAIIAKLISSGYLRAGAFEPIVDPDYVEAAKEVQAFLDSD